MKKVIDRFDGKQYYVIDERENEYCILQFFKFEEYPTERQLIIWQEKWKFIEVKE